MSKIATYLIWTTVAVVAHFFLNVGIIADCVLYVIGILLMEFGG